MPSNYKTFESLTQDNLVPITFGKLIPKEKLQEKNTENMNILQNDVHCTSWCVEILINSGSCALIIYDSFICINKYKTKESPANK